MQNHKLRNHYTQILKQKKDLYSKLVDIFINRNNT